MMITKIENNPLKDMFKIRHQISQIDVFDEYPNIKINANTKYVKYTDISTQYKMLESDSIFMFCSELSNDRKENKMLSFNETQDTYISCFFHNNSDSNIINCSDVYSQWMSYCKNGGAAFEFYFGQNLFDSEPNSENFGEIIKSMHEVEQNTFNFSLLYKNLKSKSDYILYPNFPFQVQYFDDSILGPNKVLYNNLLENIVENCGSSIDMLIPYLKHSGFVQESEARLAFVDKNHRLSKCIKFMDKANGMKIPYIEVKFGNRDYDYKPCEFLDIKSEHFSEKEVKKKLLQMNPIKRSAKYPIIIPQGHNQEEIFNVVEKVVNEMNSGKPKSQQTKIICQGHLPITKITLAPTEDRIEQKKMMEIYCRSKYWLRNVEICESTIPYNTINNNHT